MVGSVYFLVDALTLGDNVRYAYCAAFLVVACVVDFARALYEWDRPQKPPGG